MRSQFTSYEQLPITLTADHVAAALGISRANAYILLRSDGFPTLHIGKRMVVPK
ncbi:DNA-binding protein, partial [Faecalibacterium sp. 4P15]